MEDTTTKPINKTEIELRGILDKIAEVQLDSDPESTAMPTLPTEYDSTTTQSGNYYPPITEVGYYYNRKVCRYAQKHKISCKEAFKRLYK